MGLLYNISALKCSYNPGKRVVLEIDQLEIPAGKTVFIIGVSGIGKSTILETLGMMTNTIQRPEESAIVFHDNTGSKQYNLADLWKQADWRLSAFRNKHFSFIFQNTNLMNNLSAFENVQITQLIQGKSNAESRQRTKEILDILGLGDINRDHKIHNLSGGQRQRLAFARAIAPEFSVLFGDEPTGNLDMNNAYNLLDVLKQIITAKNRSAIIVSHDIDLALKYADLILYIQKGYREVRSNNGSHEIEPYGFIVPDSCILRTENKGWEINNIHYTKESLKQKLVKDLHHSLDFEN